MFQDRIYVCDGGLGSTLSLQGHNVDTDPLWSARLLHTNPNAILKVHKEFAAAGADILVTSSYQASVHGFQKYLEIGAEAALQLIAISVNLARAAAQNVNRDVLVAGSVGPYGACQGDGSEYTGAHVDTMSEDELKRWHRPRIEMLVKAGADFLAVETQPSVKEALAIVNLMREFPNVKIWVTFACKNVHETNGGNNFKTSLEQVLYACKGAHVPLIGAGINCTSPELITRLLESLTDTTLVAENIPIIVYPNSGERWTSGIGWSGHGSMISTSTWPVQQWTNLRARVIGGCCRVSPCDIANLAQMCKK